MTTAPGRRGGPAATTVAILLATLAGCDSEAPFAPSLPIVAGFRAEAAGLVMWTGAPCQDVSQIRYVFATAEGALVRAIFDSEQPRTIEQLVIGPEVAGFSVREPLPGGFDWGDYDELTVTFETGAGPRPVTTDLEPLRSGAAGRPEGTYHVRGEGWLGREQVTARDARDFLTVCTPDPADS